MSGGIQKSAGPPDTLDQQLDVEEVQPHVFRSKSLPHRLGNPAPIAYGGCALGLAVRAACKSTPENYHPYSILGHYLTSASSDRPLTCHVHEARTTRSFITRRVEVFQEHTSGQHRKCLDVTIDFHVEEPATLTYSAKPRLPYTHWKSCPPSTDPYPNSPSPAELKAHEALFGIIDHFLNIRNTPEGVASQNLKGILTDVVTSQDHLEVHAKSSADWLSVKHVLKTRDAEAACLVHVMDAGIAFMPLTFSHRFFEDIVACSSLDFALRILTPNIHLNDWHLREIVTHAAGHGRTYSESRLWDEKGNMVASMTQQCILRQKTTASQL